MSRRRFREDNQERDAKMAYLYYEKFMTLQAVGNQYGLTRERVRQIVEGQHHPLRFERNPPSITTPENLAVMQTMRKDGYNYAEIAKHFGNQVTRQRIWQILSTATT